MYRFSQSCYSEVEGSRDTQRSEGAHNVRDERSTNYSMYHLSRDYIIMKSRTVVTHSVAKGLTMSETNDLLTAKCITL